MFYIIAEMSGLDISCAHRISEKIGQKLIEENKYDGLIIYVGF